MAVFSPSGGFGYTDGMAEPIPTPRWYRLTPDRLVIGLLALECLLWLSERFQWFGINHHKGWTVLIALASVGIAGLLMLFWFCASLLFRWRFQFSIRAMLVLTIAVALPFSWFASEKQKTKTQRDTVAAISGAGGGILYDYELDETGKKIPSAIPPGWPWLQMFLNDDLFRNIAGVELPEANSTTLNHVKGLLQLRKLRAGGSQITDSTLEDLKGLTTLRWLYLANTKVTDKGLRCLTGMTQLQELDLCNTQVTNAGIEHLKVLTQLRSLELGYTQVTGDGAVGLRNALPGCTTGGADAHERHGCDLLYKKKSDEAIAELNEALKFEPNSSRTYCNRGLAWYWMKRYDKALVDYNEALRLDPNDAIAYSNRGAVWDDTEKYDKAIPDCDKAIKLNPRFATPYANRGLAWMKKGEYDKGIADFNQAIKLDPQFAKAYCSRGSTWGRKKDYRKAIRDYRQAVSLDSKDAEVFNHLAWLQATCPDQRYREGKNVVANAFHAVELSGGKWCEGIDTLAAAYAEKGDFAKAREWQTKAIDLATDEKAKQDCRSRLELYKQGKPYRMEPKSP